MLGKLIQSSLFSFSRYNQCSVLFQISHKFWEPPNKPSVLLEKNTIGTLQVIDPQHQDDQANRPPSEQVKIIKKQDSIGSLYSLNIGMGRASPHHRDNAVNRSHIHMGLYNYSNSPSFDRHSQVKLGLLFPRIGSILSRPRNWKSRWRSSRPRERWERREYHSAWKI